MASYTTGRRRCTGSRGAALRGLLSLLAGAGLVLSAGCGPVQLVATTNIPTPLVVKIPIGVALFIPNDFATYVHDEERWSTDYRIDLGKAQTEGISRLISAMFERVTIVDSLGAATQLSSSISAILEPSIEEYAFVTPRDAGSPFFAVSIKYRVNVYLPDGKLADSWGFTGYGTSPAEGLSSEGPLAAATSLAMRDAGAKLAVEFREQAVLRGLLPQQPSVDAPRNASRPQVAPLPASAPGEDASTNAPGANPEAAGGGSADPGARGPGASEGSGGSDGERDPPVQDVSGDAEDADEDAAGQDAPQQDVEQGERGSATGASAAEGARADGPEADRADESGASQAEPSRRVKPTPEAANGPESTAGDPAEAAAEPGAPPVEQPREPPTQEPTQSPSRHPTTSPKLERRLDQDPDEEILTVLAA